MSFLYSEGSSIKDEVKNKYRKLDCYSHNKVPYTEVHYTFLKLGE